MIEVSKIIFDNGQIDDYEGWHQRVFVGVINYECFGDADGCYACLNETPMELAELMLWKNARVPVLPGVEEMEQS